MSKVRIKWLSVASFEIEYDGHYLIIDPFFTDSPHSPCTIDDVDGCEIIALSHFHFDHIPDIPALVKKYDPTILCGPLSALPLAQWGDINPSTIYPMDANLELDFGWVKIKALFGVHMNQKMGFTDLMKSLGEYDYMKQHPELLPYQKYGSIEYRNYLFTFQNGTKILFWGNDCNTVQKNTILDNKQDCAIMQATGQLLDPEKYAAFIKEAGVKKIIPHHMDLVWSQSEWTEKLECLAKELKKADRSIELLIPEYNKFIII